MLPDKRGTRGRMAGFILGLWILTASGGLFLWTFTTGVGRPEAVARSSGLPPLVLFVHPLLALSGLTVWIAYLYHGGEVLPWVALAILVATAGLGDVLLLRTLRPRRETFRGAVPPERDHAHTLTQTREANTRLVEDMMPRPVMALHGTLGVVLTALVLLVALGYDGGDDASYELFAPGFSTAST